MAVLALVALGLGIFVVRPILRGNGAGETDRDAVALLDGTQGEVVSGDGAENAVQSGERGTMTAALSAPAATNTQDQWALAIGNEGGTTDGAAQTWRDPSTPSVAALKQVIEERRPDTIEILRTWLEDDTIEETA
jgi:flagellar M-ring protein FliF